MLENYFVILLFIAIATGIAMLPLIANRIIAPYKPNEAKRSPYECGFDPFDDARLPFYVRYYLVALLFIIFDLETAFLFPWAVSLREVGWLGFVAMLVFLTILLVGFIFEWKKGALEWE